MKRIIVLLLLVLLVAGCGGGQGSGDGARSEDTRQATREGSGEATERTGGGSTARGGGEETTAGAPSGQTALESGEVVIRASGGEKVRVRAEIADEVEEQTRGLMFRESLGEERGMLFVYPDEQVRSFWMRNTLIPLSIAYMDAEGRIIDIQDMKALDDEAPHYVSAKPAQYALEVNQGFFEEHGVEVGDRAELPV